MGSGSNCRKRVKRRGARVKRKGPLGGILFGGFGGLFGDKALAIHLARGNKPTDDDVFLESLKRVDAAGRSGLHKHTDGFLEGSSGEPAVGGERGAGDTQEQRLVGRASLGFREGIILMEHFADVGGLARKQRLVAGIDDADFAKHLADDDLEMFVVDGLPLRGVDVLDLLDDVLLHGVGTFFLQKFMQVVVSGVERLSGFHHVAVFDEHCFTGRKFVVPFLDLVVTDADLPSFRRGDGTGDKRFDRRLVRRGLGDDRAFADFLTLLHSDFESGGDKVAVLAAFLSDYLDHRASACIRHFYASGDIAENGWRAWGAGFKEFFDAVKTLRDVASFSDSSHVEGSHGELRSRFTDTLRCNDAHRRADLDRLVVAEVAAVALLADAPKGLAGHDGPERNRFHFVLVDPLHDLGVNFVVALGDGFSTGFQIGCKASSEDADLELLADLLAVLARNRVEILAAAVVFADNDVLDGVDETARKVTGFGGLEGGIGLTFAPSVRGDEELEHGESVFEVALDRKLDGAPGRVCHESFHAGQLRNLAPVSTGAGVDDVGDRVFADREEISDHHRSHVVFGLGPGADGVAVPFIGRDEALPVVVVDDTDFFAVFRDNLVSFLRDANIGLRDTDARLCGVMEADVLDAVSKRDSLLAPHDVERPGDEVAQVLLLHRLVQEAQCSGNDLLKLQATDGGLDHLLRTVRVRVADIDLGLKIYKPVVIGERRLGGAAEHHPLALASVVDLREEVAAEHHVLDRVDHRFSGGRLEHVVVGGHEFPGFLLSFIRKRNVHGHLVSVKVGVERGAHERMELDGESFDEQRVERLDTEAVQCRRAVEEDVLVLDHFLEDVPHLLAAVLDDAFRTFHVVRMLVADETSDDKRLEELHRHFFWKAALVQAKMRTDDDDGASGVVDALSKEVLAEASLLSFQHVGEGAKFAAISCGKQGLPRTGGVVEKRIDRLLQHAFLVAADDFRSADTHQFFETVIAVDDATVEIVEVGCGEAATVELHHRAQVRWDHG